MLSSAGFWRTFKVEQQACGPSSDFRGNIYASERRVRVAGVEKRNVPL
jgi:hypothetical protein